MKKGFIGWFDSYTTQDSDDGYIVITIGRDSNNNIWYLDHTWEASDHDDGITLLILKKEQNKKLETEFSSQWINSKAGDYLHSQILGTNPGELDGKKLNELLDIYYMNEVL